MSTADDYPREVQAIEKVGDIGETNEEKIVSLGVDVLFASFDDTTRQVAEDLEEKTKAEVIVVNPKSVDGAISSIGLVARAVGEAEKGQVVEERLRGELRQLRKGVAGEPEPSVFYEVWGDPLQTAGPGSFVDDAIRLAGGENVAADAQEPYPLYSKEVLLQKDPEYYLVGRSSGIPAEEIARRPGYTALSAVREDRVMVVNDDLIVRTGPRIVEGVREIAESIHPQASE